MTTPSLSDRLTSSIPASPDCRRHTQEVGQLKPPTKMFDFPKAKQTDPLLTRFYKAQILPRDFHLSPQQEKVLQQLTKKWEKLGSSLTLLDLIGVEICTQFETLCNNDRENPLHSKYPATLFLIYLNLFRHTRDIPLRLEHENELYKTKETLFKELREMRDWIQAVFVKKQFSIERSGFKPQTIKQMTESLDRQKEDLMAIQDLFFHCFNSPYASTLLVDHQLRYYSCVATFPSPMKETLGQYKQYIKYVTSLFTRAHERKYMGVGFQGLQLIAQELLSLKEKDPALLEMPRKIASAQYFINKKGKEFEWEFEQALQGTLNHEQWLEKHETPSMSSPSQEEFCERRHKDCLIFSLAKLFGEDLNTLLEDRVLVPLYPRSIHS